MKSSRFVTLQNVPSREIVRVANVGAVSAMCETSYGASVQVYWSSGIPSPLPEVGELWYVESHSPNSWRFVSRAPQSAIGHTAYWLIVDWRTCVGSERAVVDDVKSSGFDGIMVVVAADSQLAWDFGVDCGLVSYGDHLTQLVKRASDAQLRVRFAIDSRMWSDTSSGTQSLYTQRVANDDMTLSVSDMLSPSAAAGVFSSMAEELHELYGSMVEGITVLGFGLDGPDADFCPSAYRQYVSDGNEFSVASLATKSTSYDESAREAYDACQRDAQREFVRSARFSVGSWGLSATIPSARFCPGVSGALGARATGIWDDFGSYGWTSVGMALDYQMSADAESAMRSLEVECAELVRIAGDCPPFGVISVERAMMDPTAAMAMFAKYEVPDVVVDDYEMWRSLSDDEVDDLRSAISSNRVYEVPDEQFVGFLVSQSSINGAIGSQQELMGAIEGICSDVVDRVPHRLRCMFDSDVESTGAYDGLSAVLLSCCDRMSDTAVSAVLDVIGEGYRGVVAAGFVGSMDESGSGRTFLPLSVGLGGGAYGNEIYSGFVETGGTYVEASSYSIGSTLQGTATVSASGDASSVIVGEGVSNVPVTMSGRSSQVALDVASNSRLWPLVGELMAIAVGRKE